jgi:hypothetical protein
MSFSSIVNWLHSIRGKVSIHFSLEDIGEITMYISGRTSKTPGAIQLITAKHNNYLGTISTNGSLYLSKDIQEKEKEALLDFLQMLNAYPEIAAGIHGHMTHKCSFCNRVLTNPNSIAVGYGETCAANYRMPYGSPLDILSHLLRKLQFSSLTTHQEIPKRITMDEILFNDQAERLYSYTQLTLQVDKTFRMYLPYISKYISPEAIMEVYNKANADIPLTLEIRSRDIEIGMTPLYRNILEYKHLCKQYNPLWRIVEEDEEEMENQALREAEIGLFKRRFNWTVLKPIYDANIMKKISGTSARDYLFH